MANIRPRGSVPAPLTGTYIRQGSTLTGPVKMLLVHRSSITHAKSSMYLLRVHEDGNRSYVSSLWDTPSPGIYEAEHGGIRYTVTISAEAATFTTGSRMPEHIIGHSSGSTGHPA